MSKNILLSVCVITYNQDNFIKETLDSILNQYRDYSYEIVIGEDCSTDNTRSIIEEYVKKYPEIIKPIYNNPNKGLLNNYFNVLDNCSGKYIMECAGDDFWLPGKISNQIKIMENHSEIGMCYGKAKVFNQTENCLEKCTIGKRKETFAELMLENSIPAVTVCFRKDKLYEYIKEINPIARNWLMEDFPMWLWFSKNSKIKFINRVYAVYRNLEVSASHSNNAEKIKRFNDSCLDIRIFFAEKYNGKKELETYKSIDGFTRAWIDKDRTSLLKFSKKLTLKTITLKKILQVLIARNKWLFERIYGV